MGEPQRTADGHHVVIDGRRWRATDPSIPETFRQELVDELMDARRTRDRRRVQEAKVALGERGEPWWEVTRPSDERLAAAMMALARRRAPDGTICPSDVARAVGGGGWRALMEPVRDVARRLAHDGAVRVTQRGRELDPSEPWRGPLRIGLGARS
ncbi:MAG TPA: DUF3253 domain-containing protein [Mycobacteriales bacterium]|nr:DUF3253 domain-containing protein [Mycobacteriales bacterium]